MPGAWEIGRAGAASFSAATCETVDILLLDLEDEDEGICLSIMGAAFEFGWLML